MKKHWMLALLLVSQLSAFNALAEEGQKDDEEVYCDAVNQQGTEDAQASEVSSGDASSSSKGM
jgi:hypothetical protein